MFDPVHECARVPGNLLVISKILGDTGKTTKHIPYTPPSSAAFWLPVTTTTSLLYSGIGVYTYIAKLIERTVPLSVAHSQKLEKSKKEKWNAGDYTTRCASVHCNACVQNVLLLLQYSQCCRMPNANSIPTTGNGGTGKCKGLAVCILRHVNLLTHVIVPIFYTD
jgi:hypothetical protein